MYDTHTSTVIVERTRNYKPQQETGVLLPLLEVQYSLLCPHKMILDTWIDYGALLFSRTNRIELPRVNHL